MASNILSIEGIYKETKDKTKSDFKYFLMDKIKEKVKIDNIDELNYIDDRKALENILLLFNIATIADCLILEAILAFGKPIRL